MKKKRPDRKYAAKLLFQYRVVIDGESNKRRFCEERIVNFTARGARDALRRAKSKGKKAEHYYLNSDGNPVFFEFVGLCDLLELGIECEDDEVWYDIREMLTPMERKDAILPAEEELSVFETPKAY